MASSATAAHAHTANGASSNNSASTATGAAAPGGRPQLKSNMSNRSDGNRRQSATPIDNNAKRNPNQRAWRQGSNPITQKASNHTHTNGTTTQNKAGVPSKLASTGSKDQTLSDKNAHERLTFLFANMMGLSTTITVKSGEKFQGIFSGTSFEVGESTYLLKMVKPIGSPVESTNGVWDATEEYVGKGADHAMSFEVKNVVDLVTDNVTFYDGQSKSRTGTPSGFQTDQDISGNLAVRERTLQRWEPAADNEIDMSLESAGNTTWDQFEANERLYGVKSSYDEDLYTTSIDRSDPRYRERAAAAERIAREIEGGAALNAHVAEERGLSFGDDSGLDEEDKYSGVRRGPSDFPPLQSGGANKYTPPARRAPTSQPTVPGAPFDPAIISSQMARPGVAPAKPPSAKVVPAVPQQPTKPESNEKSNLESKNGDQTSSESGPGSLIADRQDTEASGKQSSADSAATASPSRGPGRTDNATANVEAELLDSFRHFANTEKIRVEERRRYQAKHEKDVKLNDLMKFAKNFTLKTPVPKDLVPILSKDKQKQEEIVQKAQKAAEEASVVKANMAAVATDSKNQRPVVGPKAESTVGSPVAPADRHTPRTRTGYNQQPGPHPNRPERSFQGHGPPNMPARPSGSLGQRLASMQQQHKMGAMAANVASPGPIDHRNPPAGAGISASPSIPTSLSAAAKKLDASALEFRPNPAASTFTPSIPSAAPSPKSTTNARSTSGNVTPSNFFGSKKPKSPSDRPSINAYFNPIKRMKQAVDKNNIPKDVASNGGIPPAYKTHPTWEVPKENLDKTYNDMFDKIPINMALSPSQSPHPNPNMAHQHQLPFHLQQGGMGVPHVQTPQQFHSQTQQQIGGHHFDEHRMHIPSAPQSVFPSPRLQQIPFAYPSPMSQQAQLAYGGPMQQYGMSPSGPQLTPLRPYQATGPFVSPQGGHLMVQQHSQGSFMGVPQGVGMPFNPQVPVYSPGQVHAYPHGGPPVPGASGYPSPGRGAPMMMHQGSQQGHMPQQMFIGMSPGQHPQPLYAQQQPVPITPMRGGYMPPQQPHFGTSPHQPHHFPPQHRGSSANSYGQPGAGPGPHGLGQPVGQSGGPGHSPAGSEEVK